MREMDDFKRQMGGRVIPIRETADQIACRRKWIDRHRDRFEGIKSLVEQWGMPDTKKFLSVWETMRREEIALEDAAARRKSLLADE